MKYYKKSDSTPERGFIYVASRDPFYYLTAVNACNTMRDYFPDAHVTLFTHEKFLDSSCDVFDNVIVDIPNYYRTKMWAMARTPYEKTIYVDADSVVMHKDIRTMHDYLDDCDMFFCPVTPYTTGSVKWAYIDKAMTEVPKYHGAICGYNKTDLTIDFQNTWYEKYIEQSTTPGWPYEANHYREWKVFDMFTLWRMTSGKFTEFERFNHLNIKILPLRYIITAQHTAADKKRPVIHQIDSQTWKRMPDFAKIYERKLDAIHPFKKSPIDKAPTEYN